VRSSLAVVLGVALGLGSGVGRGVGATPVGALEDASETFGLLDVAPGVEDATGLGATLLDADGDGLDDVLLVRMWAPARLLRKTSATGPWQDVTGAWGLPDGDRFYQGAGAADLDGDGHTDVVLTFDGGARVLRNAGGTHFVDETAERLPALGGWLFAPAFADLDLDGDLDLVLAGYVDEFTFPFNRCAPVRVFESRGGRFVRWEVAGLDGRVACALAASVGDLDGDGAPDVWIASDFGSLGNLSAPWKNTIAPSASQVALPEGLSFALYMMGVARADLDGDGALDLLVTTIGEPRVLLGTGAPATPDLLPANLGYAHESLRTPWSAVPVDLDGDGLEEVVLVTGQMSAAWFVANDQAQRSAVLWHAEPAAPMVDLGPALGLQAAVGLRGALVVDADADARPDLLVTDVAGNAMLWRNAIEAAAPSLRITLEAAVSAPGGRGARLTLACGSSQQVREVGVQAPFAAADVDAVRFGLGPCAKGGTLTTRWPSGFTQTLPLPFDVTTLTLAEPAWFDVTRTATSLSTVVAPVDPQGQPIAPNSVVILEATDAWPASVLAHTPQGFVAEVPLAPVSTAGERAVRVRVGGLLLPAERHVPIAPAGHLEAWVHEDPRVPGPPTQALWRPYSPGGAPLGAGHTLTSPLLEGVMSDLGDGWYATPLPVSLAETLTLSVDGAVAQVALPPVDATVSAAESTVDASGLYVTGDPAGELVFEIVARDAHRRAVLLPPSDALVLADGVPLSPTGTWVSTGGTDLRFAHALLQPGQTLQVFALGVPVGPAWKVGALQSGVEVGALTDEQTSRLGLSRGWVARDGQDVVTLIWQARDAQNAVLPGLGAPAFACEGMTPVAPGTWNGSLFLRDLRVGGSPAMSCVHIDASGAPGRAVSLASREAVSPPWDATACTLELPPPDPTLGGLSEVTVTFVPRDAGGMLSGPGLAIDFVIDPSQTPHTATYVPFGQYRATLAIDPATVPLPITLGARIGGVVVATAQIGSGAPAADASADPPDLAVDAHESGADVTPDAAVPLDMHATEEPSPSPAGASTHDVASAEASAQSRAPDAGCFTRTSGAAAPYPWACPVALAWLVATARRRTS